MQIGIVDAGGGMRGIYAAGVYDYLLEQEVAFGLCIGVSAGSANLASYLAGQKKRNYRFYMEYAFRKQYMSLKNFILRRSYVDMDYVYGTLSNAAGENPLDYPAIRDNPARFLVVVTDALTGQAKYFSKEDMRQDDYNILKASSTIPTVCRPYPVQGALYYDGALSDPVPVAKALQMGCDRVVVVLSKPERVLRTPEKDEKLALFIRRQYPLAAAQLCQRARLYNEGVALAQSLAKEGKVLIVAPEDTCGVDTLKRNKQDLQRLYEKGYQDGRKITAYLQNI